jgi:hypothetical protein
MKFLNNKKDEELKKAVRESYARVADQSGSCSSSGCCGATKPEAIAKKIGYTEEEIMPSKMPNKSFSY